MPPMQAKRDYYLVLGVAPVAPTEEIRKAYRNLSKKYHPDLNPDMKIYSDEKMKELVEAYNTLESPANRKEYDAQPYFQLRTARKTGRRFNATDFTKKPVHTELSMLDKFLALFKPKKGGSSQDAATKVDPKQADVHFSLGLTLANNDSFYDQAISSFKQAVRFDPEHQEALFNLAVICYRKGYFDEARVNFQRVLQLNKEDASARKMIGLLQDEGG